MLNVLERLPNDAMAVPDSRQGKPFALVVLFEELFIVSDHGNRVPLLNGSLFIELPQARNDGSIEVDAVSKSFS
jgi:hypothetical protein